MNVLLDQHLRLIRSPAGGVRRCCLPPCNNPPPIDLSAFRSIVVTVTFLGVSTRTCCVEQDFNRFMRWQGNLAGTATFTLTRPVSDATVSFRGTIHPFNQPEVLQGRYVNCPDESSVPFEGGINLVAAQSLKELAIVGLGFDGGTGFRDLFRAGVIAIDDTTFVAVNRMRNPTCDELVCGHIGHPFFRGMALITLDATF